MPGQENGTDYYQKNLVSQSLKGSLYEEKIIDLIKSKINLSFKEIDTKEAEKIIADFSKPKVILISPNPYRLLKTSLN